MPGPVPLNPIRRKASSRANLPGRMELVGRLAHPFGLFRAVSSMELKQIVSRPVLRRSAFVENVVALIVVTLALAVLSCLAAITPAVWTFATAAQSYIPVDFSQCLPIEDGVGRLACYDEVAPRPTKGAKAPLRTFGEAQRGRNHSNVPNLDGASSSVRTLCPGINGAPHHSMALDCWPPAPTRRSLAG